MKEKILKPDQGITHSVFGAKAQAEGEGGDEAAAEENEEGGEGKPAKSQVGDPNDILNTFKHLFIKEVVRESKIHFYKVPRLGSFMVVPLEYDSCLTVNALDAAITDYIQVKKALEE